MSETPATMQESGQPSRIDYEFIRRSKHPEYIRGLLKSIRVQEQLYSVRTHFIHELLQNAEDAGARSVAFKLYSDRLECVHDSKKTFDQANVSAICEVMESTKEQDVLKIGKFGLGFKSVYVYTSRPEIHSGFAHFWIKDYFTPMETENQDFVPDTTIILPFDGKVARERAVEEIGAALNSLDARSLLFLRNVRTISWARGDEEPSKVSSEVDHKDGHRAVTISHSNTGKTSTWEVFSRYFAHPEDVAQKVAVELAFQVVEAEGQRRIEKVSPAPLFLFLPTERDSQFGFLLQAPFRPIVGRNAIVEDDDANRGFVLEAAKLLSEALRGLAKMGLLTAPALACLPLDPNHFGQGTLLRPVFEETCRLLKEEPLIPASDGGHIAGRCAKFASSAAVRELLNPEQLTELFDSGTPLGWVSSDITERRNPEVYSFLRNQTEVAELDESQVLAKLGRPFLARREDHWMAKFYSVIAGYPLLWKRANRWAPIPKAWQLPIIRVEDGSMEFPFVGNDGPPGQFEDVQPHVFLPAEGPEASSHEGFRFVRREVLADPENGERASAFLKDLGLAEVDLVDTILTRIIPRYAAGEPALEWATHVSHIELILRLLESPESERRTKAISALQNVNLLQARRASDGSLQYRNPIEVYRKSEELAIFFEGNPNAWFLDDNYGEHSRLFEALGVANHVRIERRTAGWDNHVTISERRGHYRRGLHGFDPNCDVFGLAHALGHPTAPKSEFIWNQLVRSVVRQIAGTVESSTRAGYPPGSTISRTEVSPVGKLVRAAAWLPRRDGTFCKPAEIQMGDLPPSFSRDPELEKALEMAPPPREEKGPAETPGAYQQAAKETGIPAELLEKAAALYQRDPSALEAALSSRRGSPEQEEMDAGEPASQLALTALSEHARAWDKRSPVSQEPDEADNGESPDPAGRRRFEEANVESDFAREPTPHDRFRTVPRRILEEKENAPRVTLENWYKGRCQICGDGFFARDGDPYFVGVYLIHHKIGRFTSRAGNILCLCPSCEARFKHCTVEAPGIEDFVLGFKAKSEGGAGEPVFPIRLCGQQRRITFTEDHLLDYQALLVKLRSIAGKGQP